MRELQIQPAKPMSLAGIFIGWGLTLLAVIFYAFFPQWFDTNASSFFLLSIFLLGMPHGFIDVMLLVNPKYNQQAFPFSSRGKESLLYMLIACFYAVLWSLYPALGIGSFLLLTAWHWGSADFGRQENLGSAWYALSLTKGLVIVSSLFVYDHGVSCSVVGAFSLHVYQEFSIVVLTVSLISHVILLYYKRRSSLKRFWVSLIDLLFIVGLFASLPVLVALSVYYMFYHSLRHYQSFELLQNDNKKRKKSLKVFFVSHLISGLTFMLIFVILFYLNITNTSEISGNSVVYHVKLLAILTLPHAILSLRFQFRKQAWPSPPSIL